MGVFYFLLGFLLGVLVLRRYYEGQLARMRRAILILLRMLKREGKASPECVTPNMPTLNKMAAALKDALNIPGVRAVSRRV